MKEKQELQNEKEPNMSEFEFLVIDPIYEHAEIIKFKAGCEKDAFDIMQDETERHTESFFILSNNLKEHLRRCLNE